jgi:2-C-methyl-D-erythritol 4-phosphate cytidylyltransferase / 2-C-methyl-D-erythritol 2,4-cyclodiphosphate synthase
MPIVFLIPAAGRGLRARSSGSPYDLPKQERLKQSIPKQYASLVGKPVLAHTLEALLALPQTRALIVIHKDDKDMYEGAVVTLPQSLRERLLPHATGADTRQRSVLAGLTALRPHMRGDDIVFVHDAARPFVSMDLLTRLMDALVLHDAVIPVVPVTDTIKCLGADGTLASGPERSLLRAAQTPQAFRFDLLLEAHYKSTHLTVTDDAAVMERLGITVQTVEGEYENIKLTTADDLRQAEARMMMGETRTGFGFDVHAFGEGNHLWLGGVRIPHDRGIIAHSDGDVILHALTDAILGTMADGDIGTHFPPSDLRWQGASSDTFLRFAVQKLQQRNGTLTLIDVTLLAESPRIGDWRDTIRTRIAEIAEIDIARVSLKATTTERLGFLGRAEGIAAQAVATAFFKEIPAENGAG